MDNILRKICLVCIFVNLYLGVFNFMIGAGWGTIFLNFLFAGLCWYSYARS